MPTTKTSAPVVIDRKAKTVTITLELDGESISKTGKSIIIASTRGNVRTSELFDGKPITIGANVYRSI